MVPLIAGVYYDIHVLTVLVPVLPVGISKPETE